MWPVTWSHHCVSYSQLFHYELSFVCPGSGHTRISEGEIAQHKRVPWKPYFGPWDSRSAKKLALPRIGASAERRARYRVLLLLLPLLVLLLLLVWLLCILSLVLLLVVLMCFMFGFGLRCSTSGTSAGGPAGRWAPRGSPAGVVVG